MNKYGKIMRAVAKSPNKSNKEIAARVGVSASYVYKVKSARDDITTGNNNVAVGHVATRSDLAFRECHA